MTMRNEVKTIKPKFCIEMELPLTMTDLNIGDTMREFSARIEKFCAEFEGWIKYSESDEVGQYVRVRPKL